MLGRRAKQQSAAKQLVSLGQGVTRSPDVEMFFWIDYCSADQLNVMPYMSALPAYVAVCQLVVAYWTNGYSRRAWCRTEMLLGYAFSTMGDKLYVIEKDSDFLLHGPNVYEDILIQDPSDPQVADLTNEADRPVVRELARLAVDSQAFTCANVFARRCESDCSFRGNIRWCIFNLCCCAQACGYLAIKNSRKVQPGLSVLHKVLPPTSVAMQRDQT